MKDMLGIAARNLLRITSYYLTVEKATLDNLVLDNQTQEDSMVTARMSLIKVDIGLHKMR